MAENAFKNQGYFVRDKHARVSGNEKGCQIVR